MAGRGVRTITLRFREPRSRRDYPVHVGAGLIPRTARLLGESLPERVFVIYDRKLRRPAGELTRSLETAGCRVAASSVVASEAAKDYRRLFPLFGAMLEHGMDRGSLLFALGGGVIGDLAGFVAGTYLRGIRWVGVPTTLLAQVDSSIGGKTGVNHPLGKNLIGVVHQPSAVICDTDVLSTLAARDRMSGLGEIVKYGIAFDPKFFRWLETSWPKVLRLEPSALRFAVSSSARWKAEIVGRDEHESRGLRRQLNFGHTLGHAYEAATRYRVFRHGEAVILGMRLATELSRLRGHLSARDHRRVQNLLEALRIPKVPRVSAARLGEYLKRDKKTSGGKVTFVLLRAIGRTIADNGVEAEHIREALARLGMS